MLRILKENNSPYYVGILDLDKNLFRGEACPSNSFIFTRLNNVVTVSERAFLIGLYSELKHLSTVFIMTLAQEMKAENSPDKLFDKLKNACLNKDDEQIFKYWISCFFNKGKCKPILHQAGNKSNICNIDIQQKCNCIEC